MEFTCKIEDLKNAIAIVAPAIAARPSHPVLANILIRADEDSQSVTLIAFDLSVALHAAIDASVKYEGRITVPGTLFKDMISRQPSGLMEFELKETDEAKRISITFPSGNAEISAMDADEFPAIAEVLGTPLSLPAAAFSRMLGDVIYASSSEEQKQILNGVCVTISGGEVEFAGIDGHRLAKNAIAIEEEVPEARFVIHRKSAEGLFKLASKDGMISIMQDSRQVLVSGSRWLCVSRLLEGDFPNYSQLIPRQFEHTAAFDREELLGAVDRVSVIPDSHETVILQFTGNGRCRISCKSSEAGKVEEWVDVEGVSPFKIAFNRKYFADALKHFHQEKIELNMNSPTSPAVINAIGDADTKLALVMPIQIREL